MSLDVRILTEEDYPLWDKLHAVSPQRAIFTERWWMDIVTGGDVQLWGCFQGKTLVGGLPLWPCKTLGVRRLRQPPLTPYWGPILQPLPGKYSTQLSKEIGILRAFAELLADWPDVILPLHPSLTNWLPFYWSGFQQITRYTYRIENFRTFASPALLGNDSIRASIKRAQKLGVEIKYDIDPQLVTDMLQSSMQRQGLESGRDLRQFWPALARALHERQCLVSLAAVDPDGNVHGALASVWDDRCAYGVIGGCAERFRNSGAWTMCMYHELEFLSQKADTYDFEGSMLEPVELFFRRFGGTLTPYLHLSRATSVRLNAARALQGTFARGKSWLQRDRQAPRKEAKAQSDTPATA